MAKATASEKRHMTKVAEIGCIICLLFLDEETPATIHHVREGLGLAQRNHRKVIGLCPQHHQHGGEGVAIHANQKAFEANFGTEQSLLAEVEKLI